jgi:glycyl-tRNA synthetase beta chain
MGRVYALHDGVDKEVAEAIFEHYLPRGSDARLPQTDAGALLGMADRIDQLVGIFGLGKEPTGTADPYGLRRAALGLLRVTLARGYRFDTGEALAHARKLHGKGDVEKVWQFLLGRLEVLLREKAQPDSIQAALHTGARDLVALEKRLVALQTVREKSRAQFEATAIAVRRIANILAQAEEKGLAAMGFHPDRLQHASEKALADALQKSRERVQAAIAEKEDYLGAYSILAELRDVLDKFFVDVLVMDPDHQDLRDNRLALLRSLHELFAPLADFARLQVEKSA